MTDPTDDVTVVPPLQIANLAKALAAFQSAMPTVTKSKTANIPGKEGKSGYSYKYADLADVSAAAMPLLAKNGLAFICQPEEGLLRGILVHESGEYITGHLPIYGRDNQSIGGSLSYGRRYLLGALTGIVTDEDTDAQNGGTERTTRQKPAAQSKTPPKQQEAPAAAPVLAEADQWIDKIGDAKTFDELTAVYNEADRLGILGHMMSTEPDADTLKSRLFSARNALSEKGAQ